MVRRKGPLTAELWMGYFGDWFVPIPETGCWIWMRSTNPNGYGMVHHNKRMHGAHRVAYELLCGPIQQGFELDHTCRVRCCVNPAHMQPVTHKENCLRGSSMTTTNAQKTHCEHGHEFTAENTRYYGAGHRQCRPCHLSASRRHRLRQRFALVAVLAALAGCGRLPSAPNQETLAVYCHNRRGDLSHFGNHKRVAKGCMGYRIPWDGIADPVVVR